MIGTTEWAKRFGSERRVMPSLTPVAIVATEKVTPTTSTKNSRAARSSHVELTDEDWVNRSHSVESLKLSNRFAHSVVPIIVGYVVAHYLSYFVEVGQQTVVQLSDPLARGQDLLGTSDLRVSYWLSTHPTFLAVLKVLSVVTGHVLGVVAAHDRAIKLLPRRHQLTGQLPLLLVMVFYTVTGLYLLFGA